MKVYGAQLRSKADELGVQPFGDVPFNFQNITSLLGAGERSATHGRLTRTVGAVCVKPDNGWILILIRRGVGAVSQCRRRL